MTTPDPKQIAEYIDNHAHFDPHAPNSIKFILDDKDLIPHQVEAGAEFGKALDDALRDLGWERYLTHSYCKKAPFEANLHKRDCSLKVSIISSVFFGHFTFTQIDLT